MRFILGQPVRFYGFVSLVLLGFAPHRVIYSARTLINSRCTIIAIVLITRTECVQFFRTPSNVYIDSIYILCTSSFLYCLHIYLRYILYHWIQLQSRLALGSLLICAPIQRGLRGSNPFSTYYFSFRIRL